MKKYFGTLFCIHLILIAFSQILFAQTTEKQKPRIKDFGSSLSHPPEENLVPKKVKKDESTIDDDVIKIDVNLVVVDCLVLDEKGNSILGLKPDNFIITEDDQPQEIQFFTLGNDAKVPRSIVLIIDYSVSQLPFIERSVEAAKVLVDKLQPHDLMAIVTDDVEIIAQFTSDKVELKKKLESLKKKSFSFQAGKSQQFSSLYAVLNEMFDEEDVQPIILFQTDGDQLFFLKEGLGVVAGQIFYQNGITSGFPQSGASFSLNDLTEKIKNTRATIYSIVPGVKPESIAQDEKKAKENLAEKRVRSLYKIVFGSVNFDSPTALPHKEKVLQDLVQKYYPNGLLDIPETMLSLSNLSGGWLDFLEKPEDAERIYSRILSGINDRYIMGFIPTNETRDGKRRTVKIEVKGHPEYIVWGRKTYKAPLPD